MTKTHIRVSQKISSSILCFVCLCVSLCFSYYILYLILRKLDLELTFNNLHSIRWAFEAQSLDAGRLYGDARGDTNRWRKRVTTGVVYDRRSCVGRFSIRSATLRLYLSTNLSALWFDYLLTKFVLTVWVELLYN